MTDRPGKPDTEPRLPDVEATGPELLEIDIPRMPTLPSDLSTQPPATDTYDDPAIQEDPMQHAPAWGKHILQRMGGVLDRLGAIEEALRLMGTTFDIDSDLRRSLVADISHAMARYVDPLLADNASIKQSIVDLDERLKIVEGKIAELKHKKRP